MNFKNYIIRDPQIRNGVPIIKGTRITLKAVLGHLVLGDSIENILKTYPELTTEALTVVVAYAAAAAGLEIPDDGIPEVHLNNSSSTQFLSNEQVTALLSTAYLKDTK